LIVFVKRTYTYHRAGSGGTETENEIFRGCTESSPDLSKEEEFLTADGTGFSQIIEREDVLEPFILSASCFICG
jgi:hypothetical protein